MKRLIVGLLLLVGGQALSGAEMYLNILSTPTPIQKFAGPNSEALYMTNEESIFKVLDKVGEYYKVQLPAQEEGFIHYRFGQLFSGAISDEALLLAPLSFANLAPITYNPKQFAPQENYRFPRRPRNRNIDLDVDGFYEFKLSGRDFSPKIVTDSRWQTIINDPIYTKIPKDVLLGPMKPEMRYKIGIDGKLDDNLSLHYDIEQEPDFPGKYDVQIKYKQHELTFYDFDADYDNGEYINVKKALRGAKYEAYTKNLEYIIATGGERSEPQKFEGNGSGLATIKVGNTSLLEGSIRVWVNNKRLKEGVDFSVNYFKGEITFVKAPQQIDFIKVVYEFTNPIQDFLPVLSQKSFFGAQIKWRSEDKFDREILKNRHTQVLWSPSVYLAEIEKLRPKPLITEKPPTLNTLILDILKEELANLSPSENALMKTGTSSTAQLPKDSILISPSEPEIPTPDIEIPSIFYLQHTPLVLGQEQVYLNGFEMIRNKDYFIRPRSGRLILNQSLSTSDVLEVTYMAYSSHAYKEDIIAKNSPGPYYLKNSPIVDGSVSVRLNEDELAEITDYLVDADKGELMFNYAVDYPSVISIDYEAIDTQLVTINAGSNRLNFGVTYLEENARSKADELELSVSSENHTIASSNIITLQNNPILKPEELLVYKGDTLLPSSNYTLTDEGLYKGQIALNDLVPGNYSVSYKYKKSILSKAFLPIRFYRVAGPYSNVDEADFKLPDIPVKFKGIDYIEISRSNSQEIQKLNEGDEFTVDYGVSGEEIQITFIKTDSINGSLLETYPQLNDSLMIVYQHPPNASSDPGDLTQRMIGITAGTRIGKNWHLNTELAAANHNFSKPREQGDTNSTPIKGSGSADTTYKLPHANLVEDTESVFIKNIEGTLRLNKNEDYYINYTRGEIRLRQRVLSPEEEIVANYEYFTNVGTTQAAQKSPFTYAKKFSTTYEKNGFSAGGHYKSIDKDFLPIGDIQETKGTTVLGGEMDWNISSKNSFSMQYDRRKEDKGTKDNNEPKFLTKDDLHAEVRYRFLNYFDTEHDMTYLFSLEDPAEANAAKIDHPVDDISFSLNSKATFGPDYWRWSIAKGNQKSRTDHVDNLNPVTTEIDTHAYNTTFQTKKMPILKSVLFNPFYQNTLSSTEKRVEGIESFVNRQSYGINSSYQPFKGFSAQANYGAGDVKSQSSAVSTLNVTETVNTLYSAAYAPYNWFNTSWSNSHRESDSPFLNQKGLISDTVNFKVSRYSFYGMLTTLGVPHRHFTARPFKDSYTTFSTSQRSTKENNLQNQFVSRRDIIGFYKFMPINGISLDEWSFNTYDALRRNTVPTTTSSSNITDQLTKNESIGVSVKPPYPFLDHFDYRYNFRETEETTISKRLGQTVTSNITNTNKPSFTRNQNLAFKSGPIIAFKRFNLGAFSAYINEQREDSIQSVLTEQFSPGELLKDIPIPSTSNLEEDSSFFQQYVLGVTVSPFNKFTLDSTATSSNRRLKRNITQAPGLTLQHGHIYDFKLSYPVFRFLTLDAGYTHNRAVQWRSPSLNISESLIQTFDPSKDASIVKDKLDNLTLSRIVGASFTPFQFITLTSSGSHETISERFISPSTSINKTIEKLSATAGLSLRLFKNFRAGYSYSVNRFEESGTYNKGQEGVTTVTYSPVTRDNFQVNIKYSRNDNWGRGINQLEQSSTEQGSGDIIQTEIVERDDTVELGSLQVDIKIPMKRSPYIENIVITGEGYLKVVTDRRDPEKFANGEDQESFNITGLILKSTVNF